MSEKTRTERFTQELKELLSKYKAEIEVEVDTDNWGHYSGCSIQVYMDTVWTDDNGEVVEPYTVADLGKNVRP